MWPAEVVKIKCPIDIYNGDINDYVDLIDGMMGWLSCCDSNQNSSTQLIVGDDDGNDIRGGGGNGDENDRGDGSGGGDDARGDDHINIHLKCTVANKSPASLPTLAWVRDT